MIHIYNCGGKVPDNRTPMPDSRTQILKIIGVLLSRNGVRSSIVGYFGNFRQSSYII
jgi:hypothetical protein